MILFIQGAEGRLYGEWSGPGGGAAGRHRRRRNGTRIILAGGPGMVLVSWPIPLPRSTREPRRAGVGIGRPSTTGTGRARRTCCAPAVAGTGQGDLPHRDSSRGGHSALPGAAPGRALHPLPAQLVAAKHPPHGADRTDRGTFVRPPSRLAWAEEIEDCRRWPCRGAGLLGGGWPAQRQKPRGRNDVTYLDVEFLGWSSWPAFQDRHMQAATPSFPAEPTLGHHRGWARRRTPRPNCPEGPPTLGGEEPLRG